MEKYIMMRTLIFIAVIFSVSSGHLLHLHGQTGIEKSPHVSGEWVKIETNTIEDLVKICFPDAQTGYVVGNKTLLKSHDGGKSWEKSVAEELDMAVDAWFTDTDNGYVLRMDGSVARTTTGGDSWQVTGTKQKAVWYSSISMTGPNSGFIVGSESSPGGATGSVAKQTVDGINWTDVTLPFGGFLNKVHFTDDQAGFILGNTGNFLRTTNGGDDWNLLFSGTANSLSDITFNDSVTGYMTTGLYGAAPQVLKSTDAGLTWEIIYDNGVPKKSDTFTAISFGDNTTGYISCSDGNILKTTDGGYSWNAETTNTSIWLSTICMVNPEYGFAAGQDGLLLRLGEPSGIYPYDIENLHVDISPNPCSDRTKIRVTGPGVVKYHIRICDMHGNEVNSKSSDDSVHSNSETVVETSELEQGIYLVRVESVKMSITRKLVIRR